MHRNRFWLTIGLVVAITSAAWNADAEHVPRVAEIADGEARPAGEALSNALTPVLTTFVDARAAPGIAVAVTTADETLVDLSVGWKEPHNRFSTVAQPTTGEEIYWIASITKPISATAFMTLVDEGLVDLDDPVSNYLPQFDRCRTDSGLPFAVTLRHCLTHTSGIQVDRKVELKSRAEFIEHVCDRPLKFRPGSEWQYSSSLDVVAAVAEKVSGQSFDEFVSSRLLEPLGMDDTTFHLTAEQAERAVVPTVLNKATGGLSVSDIEYVSLDPAEKKWPRASGGLFSTSADLCKFARFIMSGGKVGDRRLLSERAVEAMTSLQTGELETGWTPGNGWGLGWCVVRWPQHVTRSLSPNSFGHGGAYGPQFWIDPEREVAYILLLERKDIGNSDGSDFREAFQVAAARALDAAEAPTSQDKP